MATPQSKSQSEMAEQEIIDVFKTLHLPTDRAASPGKSPQAAPVVYYPITGNSLPLSTG